jgi:uncharacterized protein involved in exopolysaccharide biosynthesis
MSSESLKEALLQLQQLANGCTSGRLSEWPALKPAAALVVADHARLEQDFHRVLADWRRECDRAQAAELELATLRAELERREREIAEAPTGAYLQGSTWNLADVLIDNEAGIDWPDGTSVRILRKET